jgi:hypothetical protein
LAVAAIIPYIHKVEDKRLEEKANNLKPMILVKD